MNELLAADVSLNYDWKQLIRATIYGRATMTQDMPPQSGKSNILPLLHLCAVVTKRPIVICTVVPITNGAELGDKYITTLKVRVRIDNPDYVLLIQFSHHH